ncbi:MAG TPA: DUF501 domain-containing protein [Gaiella sp.]|jgi:hypothetical protein
MDDRAVVAAQLGREPRAFRRVVVRCPFGGPAVTEQHPFTPGGEPFPTTYWLTCRHLVAAVSRLEAAGGVERWSAAVASDETLRVDLERASEEQRAIRRALVEGDAPDGGASLELGIGGSRNPVALKCLHAHVAYALAQPGHRLGEAVLEEVPERWPTRCCSDLSLASRG